MINLRNRKELTLFSVVTQPFTSQNTLKPGDFVSLNLTYPFEKELYNQKLKALKNLIDDKRIISENNHFNIAFNLDAGMPGTYKDWKFVIDYAKEHNIVIKLNSVYACSPAELEQYLEKFTKVNENGEKELIFSRQTTLIENNPFTQTKYYNFE